VYRRVEHILGAPLGWAPASLLDIILGWKSWPVRNTLDYYTCAYCDEREGFNKIVTGPML